MNPADIISAISGLSQLATVLTALAREAKGDFSSEDEKALQGALAELRAANDVAYDAVQARLAEAAKLR